ncbi:FecCD family ABC transporter permease [Marinobacter fonticola]|uniref:FecCD family ABC transporter permease n=1 Tax=Marinobacter fonticola TaxID=2603215 RepID=UPI0011E781CD|nr:iron ABC transporter permease [Marinobacter fonticola]
MSAEARDALKLPLLRRTGVLMWLGCGLIVLTPWLGLQFGATDLSLQQVLAGLSGEGSTHVQRVVVDLRLPRALIGLIIGVHFAVSGWLLQLLTRNPLAEAGILGISGGASLVAVAAFVVGDWLQPGDNPYAGVPFALQYLPLLAMLGGLLAALAVYGLSLRHGGLSPMKLTLTGAVLAGMLHALTTGGLAFWGHAHTELVAQWLAGSLYGTTWAHLEALLPWTLIGLLGVLILLRPLSAMQLEDEHARSLGLHLNRWRAIALVVAALMAASAVGIVGPVGFIGLLVPHISRRLAGSGLGVQFLLCTALGAMLAVLADTLGRTVFAPYELPVGVVSAALGVPFFLYLLSRQP